MTIEFFGFMFRKLKSEHLEMLRKWRNAEWLRPYMHDKTYISHEMQLAWFERISNLNNWFFIIEKNGQALGLISLKSVDYNTCVAEPGIMLGIEKHADRMIASSAGMLLLGEFGFHFLGMRKLVAHMYEGHKRSLTNNRFFGAKAKRTFGKKSVFTEANIESFEEKAPKVRLALKRVTGKSGSIRLCVSPIEEPEIYATLSSRLLAISPDQSSRFTLDVVE